MMLQFCQTHMPGLLQIPAGAEATGGGKEEAIDCKEGRGAEGTPANASISGFDKSFASQSKKPLNSALLFTLVCF